MVVDDQAGVALGTRYLISLGHRHIAHIAGPQNVDTARRRRRGFVNAMAEAGLDTPAGYIVESTFNEVGGATAAAALLRLDPSPHRHHRRQLGLRPGRDGSGSNRRPGGAA